jgi:four helix bundle protein
MQISEGTYKMNKRDLNERLIDFAVMAIKITDGLLETKGGNHLGGQLVRSGTSPALNYGEAQSGESRKDFVHNLQIVLKELRETLNALQIINKAKLYKDVGFLELVIKENDELASIFVKSVSTAKKNDNDSQVK